MAEDIGLRWDLSGHWLLCVLVSCLYCFFGFGYVCVRLSISVHIKLFYCIVSYHMNASV